MGAADALELGEMRLESHLNEALDATFTIGNISASSLEDIKVTIAGAKAYQSLGLSRPAYLSRLTFNITAGQGPSYRVQVNSRQRLSDPIIELLVEVTEKQSRVMRLYTLMLDPLVTETARESTKDTVIESPVNQLIAPTQVTQSREVIEQKPAPVYDRSVSTIRVDNSSISIISQNSYLHDSYSVYQIMRAFYLQNPGAFLNGNINKLESGVLLQVPLEQLVAEIPRQQAINFVYSVSTDNATLKSANPPRVKPGVDRTESSVPEIEAETEAVPVMLSNSLPERFTQAVQISSDVQQDLISWRGMTDEFKNLSAIVGQQNQVIKLQSDVVKDISFQLDARTSQLFDFDKRLSTLEQSVPVTQVIAAGDEPAVQQLLQELSQVKQQQSQNMQQVNAQLDVKNQEISRLNSRIVELENGLAGLPIDQGNLRVEDTSEPAEIVVSDGGQIGLMQNSRIWWFVLLAIVLLFAAREFGWRRRVQLAEFAGRHKSRASVITPVVEETAQPLEAMSQQHRKKPDARLLSDSIAMKLETQEKNKQFAKESKSRAEKSAQAGLAAVPSSSAKDINDAVNQVHAEIDVLIAYELFVEAQELVDTTKQKYKEDHWLVIKELEILAYLKDVDLFLSRVEHEKNQLSQEFPVAWKKILKMRDDLCSEFKLASIH